VFSAIYLCTRPEYAPAFLLPPLRTLARSRTMRLSCGEHARWMPVFT